MHGVSPRLRVKSSLSSSTCTQVALGNALVRATPLPSPLCLVSIALIMAWPALRGDTLPVPASTTQPPPSAATDLHLWKKDIAAKVLPSQSNDVELYYVELPFDDLAHPDLAKKWLPTEWCYPVSAGEKPVSSCLNQWIEIKNESGDICYAQWKGAGKGPSDDADYVFGASLPKEKTGLKISPSVAQYLRVTSENARLSWRFVEGKDVPPGYWLKREEEAVLFSAMHEAGPPAPPVLTSSSSEKDYWAAYMNAYLTISRAQHSEKKGDRKEARAIFVQASNDLRAIQTANPRWETIPVQKRIGDIQAKLDELAKPAPVKLSLQQEYLNAFLRMKEADEALALKDYPVARAFYIEALQRLKSFNDPDLKPGIAKAEAAIAAIDKDHPSGK